MRRHKSLVNIGLETNDGDTIKPSHAMAALSAIGGVHALVSGVHKSDTEDTLVAEINRPLTAAAAYVIAQFLRQDAIAQWDGYEGQLYGPNADAWGDFDPAFFLTLDGTRLEVRDVAA